jgi:hypothetical protein
MQQSALNIAAETEIGLVLGLHSQRTAHTQFGVMVVLLDVETDRHVVVHLVVTVVQLHRLLVIVNRLLVYAQRKIGVPQILVQTVLLLVLQTLLQYPHGLRVTSHQVEGCGLVVDENHGELLRLATVLDPLEHLVANNQTVLRTVELQIDITEVFGHRKVVVSVSQGRLQIGYSFLSL